MTEGSKTAKHARSEHRRRRQAAELRANLGKRKEQARARAAAEDRQGRGEEDRPDEA